MTKFCDRCGKILHIIRENDHNIGKCDCGFSKVLDEISSTESIKKQPEKGKGSLKEYNQLATYPHECKKCGHNGAQVIEMGIWFSDEAGVVRYRCGKCGFTEQEKGSNS